MVLMILRVRLLGLWRICFLFEAVDSLSNFLGRRTVLLIMQTLHCTLTEAYTTVMNL